MNSISFPPPKGYMTVLKSHHPNYIPDRLKNQVFGSSSHIGAGIFRDGNGWYLHMNSFVDVTNDDILAIVNTMNTGYELMNDRPNALNEGKFIKRTVSDFSSKFLNELSDLDYLAVQPVSLIGTGETIIAFSYPESVLEGASKILLEMISGSEVPIEIMYHKFIDHCNSPFFFIYHDLVSFDYSRLMIVKTSWNISRDNIPEGLDTSEAIYFYPNVYDSSINRFIAFSNDSYFYMPIPNQWVKTFREYSLQPVGGAIYYWGKVKGNKVEEYYIFNRKFENIFLNSLANLWKHSPWKLGNPHLRYINNLKSVKDELGL